MELAAVLLIMTLPFIVPLVAGSNVTFRATVAPGATLNPPDAPVALRPGPERTTFEMVKFALPEFEIVIVCVLLPPRVTLPKLMAAGMAESCPCNGVLLEELLPEELLPEVLVIDDVPTGELFAEEVVIEEPVPDELLAEEVEPEELLPEDPPGTPALLIGGWFDTPVPVSTTLMEEPFALAKTSCPLKE